MPRKSRIDAPGALHHIIVRGIERRKIFFDDADRNNFVDRVGGIVAETNTTCYAWALLPNHSPLVEDWPSTGGHRYETLVNRPCGVFQ